MQVKINNKDIETIPLSGKLCFGCAEDCDVILSETNSPYAFTIKLEKYACILDVNSESSVLVNQININQQSILNPGDVLKVDNNVFEIIDDNSLPRVATSPFKLNQERENNDDLLTSVSGLRSFNSGNNGELFILDKKTNFTYKSNTDTAFAVSFTNRKLTLLCKKGDIVKINGNECDSAILKHGDYISTKQSKFCVESPGSSAYSKYSPSHPRNMQLSEEYLEQNQNSSPTNNSFFKKNLWWISMLAGLVVISILLILIKSTTNQ